jgi:ribose transport system substrate-binding protein
VDYQRIGLNHYLADYVVGQKNPRLKAVILVPAASGDEITAQIKQLREANVPVVIVDLRITEDALLRAHTDYSAYIGSQNREGGALAAEQMAKRLPNGGAILMLNGLTTMAASGDRRAGFIDKLTKLGKQNSVQYKITERSANFLRIDAQNTVYGLLKAGQKFDGIFAANDEMALGALEAIHQSSSESDEGNRKNSNTVNGKESSSVNSDDKTIVIGFDATAEAVKAVNDGRLAATIAQDPVGMGQRAAETADKLIKHEPVEKEQILSPKILVHE